jgi:hypothetical protein
MTKSFLKGLALAGLGLALVSTRAQAQKPGVELGINFIGFSAINPDGDDNNISAFNIGTASFGGQSLTSGSGVTAAFYLTEMIAIEPRVGFGSAKAEGADDGVSILSLGVGVPIYLKKGWGKAGGIFVTPFVGYSSISSGGESAGAMHFGADAGFKGPISENIFWRGAVGFDMGQENEDDGIPKMTTIGLQLGITAYLN